MKPINVRKPAETFLEELKVFSEYQLDSCFGDGECMRVCPVVDKNLTIAELNNCTLESNSLTEAVRNFTFECFQCGHCTSVCPGGVQRDVLMIFLKYKALAEKEPKHIKKYYKAKGISGWNPKKPASKTLRKEIMIRGYNFISGSKLGKLKKHVDKTKFKKSDNLFYFGCYIFSHTGVQFKTLELADKLGLDYEVLGGLKSCCGWPQLLGGRIEEAEYLHRYVSNVIEQIKPKRIITGCMECFVSLKRMLQINPADYQPMTTSQWLLSHADELGISHCGEDITFHDSCHCSRKMGLEKPARELLKKMYTLKEMKKNRDQSLCCGYYNFKVNPKLNESITQCKMNMAHEIGVKKMAVECITCQESFETIGNKNGISVTDLVDLVHKNVI